MPPPSPPPPALHPNPLPNALAPNTTPNLFEKARIGQHLESHLDRLPPSDAASRSIVQQMKADEARHGAAAQSAGAAELPLPVRWIMRAAARVMTVTAHRI